MTMYPVSTYQSYPKLLGRMAEIGVLQVDLAMHLDMHPTLLNAILRGRRSAPSGFEARAHAALDLLERAEQAAQEARERVLAEGPESGLAGASDE